jgi:hypothetical protein
MMNHRVPAAMPTKPSMKKAWTIWKSTILLRIAPSQLIFCYNNEGVSDVMQGLRRQAGSKSGFMRIALHNTAFWRDLVHIEPKLGASFLEMFTKTPNAAALRRSKND